MRKSVSICNSNNKKIRKNIKKIEKMYNMPVELYYKDEDEDPDIVDIIENFKVAHEGVDYLDIRANARISYKQAKNKNLVL